ncbi:hypothetical protein DFQ28_011648 [Apophysomyces sp. BC1034]|nr:hypothetical protein DFQ30_008494 [Apophysomyces sp. BC1015]KAG0183097.1 hypothetical protein DFQ29_000100 [Apophysomyces sp. BC1021]KAG0191531.1 hypothetical protein DFQ28_011648 [Apophysomyces sp. BC1034]
MTFAPHPNLSQEYTDIINELTDAIHANNPKDILQFCSDFFQTKLAMQREFWQDYPQKTADHPYDVPTFTITTHPTDLSSHSPTSVQLPTLQDPYDPYSTDDDDEDLFEDEQEDMFNAEMPNFSFLSACNRGRRTSVSAESMTPSRDTNFMITVIPKTTEQQARIQSAIETNFLFRNLDENQYKDVINAMTEKVVQPNETVIQQGAIGDYFYIVESGTLDCYIFDEASQEPPKKVTSYGPCGSFGELALMYNSPRAATIIATSPGVLWALDRMTFRRILMENTSQKRQMYESFLAEVPILASLDAYERYKIADALESVGFEDGQNVIVQNEIGHNFYLIESGEAIFYKTDENGVQKEVNRLRKGAYFGELALLNDSPRAATVVACGRLKCATLGKKGFNRLLGPILNILKRNSENYAKVMQANSP